VNHVLGGRFVLGRELGSGGVARVFLGSDTVLDRHVAVKILDPEEVGEESAARFEREGRTAARLSHPNIVQVYDAGDDELDGRHVSYIVMEYVRGGDLKKMISGRGKLPEGEAARIGADVAGALAHAHEAGIVHRDVKPQNVLIDPYGYPKLADFGIARALDAETTHRPGTYLGTAVYSSPEQLSGGEVSPKSDVYSFGATLYEAVTGRAPYTGAPLEVASQQLNEPIVPPRERGVAVSRPMEELILACLSMDPKDRPDAGEVRERLLGISAANAASRKPRREPAGLPMPSREPRNEPGARRVGAAGAARAAGLLGAAGAARAAGARGLGALVGGVRGRQQKGGAAADPKHAPNGAAKGVPGAVPNGEALGDAPQRAGGGEGAGAASGAAFQTFRTGPDPRVAALVVGTAVIALVLAVVLLFSVLRGGGSGEDAGRQDPPAGERRAAVVEGGATEESRGEDEGQGAGGETGEEGASEEERETTEERGEQEQPSAPAPPLEEAANNVYEVYVANAENRFADSWALLSPRYQEEIGSLEEWTRQNEPITEVSLSGGITAEGGENGTARVPVEGTEFRTDGDRQISGTWIVVNENGEWRLDRFEGA